MQLKHITNNKQNKQVTSMSKQMLSKWFEDFKNNGTSSDAGMLFSLEWITEEQKEQHRNVVNKIFDFSRKGIEDREIDLEDLNSHGYGIIFNTLLDYKDELIISGLVDGKEMEDIFTYEFDYARYCDLVFALEGESESYYAGWFGKHVDFRMFTQEEISEIIYAFD
jgi:hypothetical protein